MGQRLLGRSVQSLGELLAQTAAFSGQRLTDHRLQGRVTGTDDSVLVEISDQLGDDEADGDIAANDLDQLLLELREERCRPEPIVEQLGDHRALRVMLVLGDGQRFEGAVAEIARQDEGTIRLHLVPGEAEEGMLGLEIADLQDTIDLCM